MTVQIKDFINATPTTSDYIPLSQAGNTRKATLSQIRGVVNDVTTGGTDVSLSAEQGKNLSNKIGDLLGSGLTETDLATAIKNDRASLSDLTKIPGVVDDSGSANTYVITLTNAPTAYAKYQTFKFIAKTANTGASTLNVNGLGVKALVKDVNVPLVAGDILVGQIVVAVYDGTNFQIVPDFKVQFALKADLTATPQKTTSDITYYVDATNGNDSNNGLTSGTAFKTIAKAISIIPQVVNHNIIIRLTAGTYNEYINVYGFTGKGIISFIGGTNTSDAVNYIVKAVSISECSCKINLTAITTNTTTDHAFISYSNIYVEFIKCICTANTTTYGFVVSNGGSAYIGGCISSNRGIGILSQFASIVISDNNTGTGNTTGLTVIYGGTIAKAANQPLGTVNENIATGGVIR